MQKDMRGHIYIKKYMEVKLRALFPWVKKIE